MGYRTVDLSTVPPDVDPRGGFFGDIFHAVTGVVGGAVKGFVSGGPIGAITGAIGGAVTATQDNIAAQTPTGGSDAGVPPPPSKALIPAGIASVPVKSGPGTGIITQSPLGTPVSAKGLAKQGAMRTATGAVVPLKGYHVSAKTGKLVRHRHMNWANHRALSRAGRRIKQFVKHARKFISITHPHKAGTVVRFKHKGRR